MKRDQFLRRLRKIGRLNGVIVSVDLKHGKGGHARVFYGDRGTTVPSTVKEPGMRNALLKQLGLTARDWES